MTEEKLVAELLFRQKSIPLLTGEGLAPDQLLSSRLELGLSSRAS